MTDRPVPTGPAAPDLTIVETRVYRGPNIWSYGPAIHLVVDLGSLEEYPSDTLPGLHRPAAGVAARRRASTPARGGARAGSPSGCARARGSATSPSTSRCSCRTRSATTPDAGKTRSTGEPGRYHVIFGYQDESVALAAGKLAVRMVNDLVTHDPEFDFDAEFEEFLLLAERTAFGPSTQALVDEAVSRDIPWMRLNSASLVQLGQGRYAQRIRATMTSNTSALGVDIASDKDITNKLLSAAGLPVPKSDSVRTLRGALQVARRIGYPVVIKPLDGNHGRGVVLNITDDAELEAGYDVARAESRSGYLQVESYITGNDYRFLVVGGRIAAVAERVPAHVIGDGHRTVAELVEATNADPRRGVGPREGAHPDQGRRRGDRPGRPPRAWRWTPCPSRA